MKRGDKSVKRIKLIASIFLLIFALILPLLPSLEMPSAKSDSESPAVFAKRALTEIYECALVFVPRSYHGLSQLLFLPYRNLGQAFSELRELQ